MTDNICCPICGRRTNEDLELCPYCGAESPGRFARDEVPPVVEYSPQAKTQDVNAVVYILLAALLFGVLVLGPIWFMSGSNDSSSAEKKAEYRLAIIELERLEREGKYLLAEIHIDQIAREYPESADSQYLRRMGTRIKSLRESRKETNQRERQRVQSSRPQTELDACRTTLAELGAQVRTGKTPLVIPAEDGTAIAIDVLHEGRTGVGFCEVYGSPGNYRVETRDFIYID